MLTKSNPLSPQRPLGSIASQPRGPHGVSVMGEHAGRSVAVPPDHQGAALALFGFGGDLQHDRRTLAAHRQEAAASGDDRFSLRDEVPTHEGEPNIRGGAWEGDGALLRSVLGLVPARGCSIVAGISLDPAAPSRPALALPERRAGLEIVHQEFRGAEGRLAVLRGGDDQHDIVARAKRPVPMHDEAGLQWPAGGGLRLDALKFCFRHAGIVLELHLLDGVAAGVIAHGAHEGDDGADVAPPSLQLCDLGADVEVVMLDF